MVRSGERLKSLCRAVLMEMLEEWLSQQSDSHDLDRWADDGGPIHD